MRREERLPAGTLTFPLPFCESGVRRDCRVGNHQEMELISRREEWARCDSNARPPGYQPGLHQIRMAEFRLYIKTDRRLYFNSPQIPVSLEREPVNDGEGSCTLLSREVPGSPEIRDPFAADFLLRALFRLIHRYLSRNILPRQPVVSPDCMHILFSDRGPLSEEDKNTPV